MKKRLSLIFCLLLSGCTDADWDRVMRYGGMDDTAAQPAPVRTNSASAAVSAPPAEAAGAAQAANTDFCRSVAMQDASGNGFDPATQQRVFARSYAQCMALNVR